MHPQVPVEKAQNKTDEPKLIWAPIFRATLKRTEGVGELSLNKVACSGLLPKSVSAQRKATIGEGKEQKQVCLTISEIVVYMHACLLLFVLFYSSPSSYPQSSVFQPSNSKLFNTCIQYS